MLHFPRHCPSAGSLPLYPNFPPRKAEKSSVKERHYCQAIFFCFHTLRRKRKCYLWRTNLTQLRSGGAQGLGLGHDWGWWACQSGTGPTSQPVNQVGRQEASRPLRQPVKQSTSRETDQQSVQFTYRAVKASMRASHNQTSCCMKRLRVSQGFFCLHDVIFAVKRVNMFL